MIKERVRKIFTYDAEAEMGDADLLLAEFSTESGYNPEYNSRFVEDGPAEYLTSGCCEEGNRTLVAAFCDFLTKKSPNPLWGITAIQPIPGMLKIELEHRLAATLDLLGEEECTETMTAEELAEAKRIHKLFDGYTATLVYAPSEQSKSRGDFVLKIDSGSLVVFRVEPDKTTIELGNGKWPKQQRNYALTWKNQKHKKFYADIEITFSLE